jgi:FkbH-like protein
MDIDFAWKAPLSAGWDALHREAVDLLRRLRAEPDAARELGPRVAQLAHRLACERLGPLEQLRLEKMAAQLWPYREYLAPLHPLTLGLIGNRTLDLLAGPLRAAGLARLLLIEPLVAPLDSAAAIAHGHSMPFQSAPDLVLLWQDEEAYQPPATLLDETAELRAVEAARDSLHALANGIVARTQAQVIVATIPQPRRSRIGSGDAATVGSAQRFVERLNGIIAEGALAQHWLLWDVVALAAELGHRRWFDPTRFFEAKLPFRADLMPLACDHLARLLAAHAGKARRALVLDLDNTLWHGVIGDDGLEGIVVGQGSAVGEAFLAVQSLALELRRRGVVLCVCSKNDAAVAREPFRNHPDMLLREEHIAVFQASWEDKATSLQAIAQALGLGVESLAFVDDNPAERARVRQELPFVAVPELAGQPADYADLIVASGAFEHLPLNRDDLARAQSYQAGAKTAALRDRIGNYEEYLRSLQMVMQVQPFDAVGLPRIAQLISKSNQFNLTTRRHDAATLAEFAADPATLCWQVRLADAFADHGMIAVLIVRQHQGLWIIDTWLQSCRILERGVEQTLMNLLMRSAAARDAKVFGQYLPTPRNGLVKDLLPRLGFAPSEAPENGAGGGEWYVADPAGFTPLFSAIEVR